MAYTGHDISRRRLQSDVAGLESRVPSARRPAIPTSPTTPSPRCGARGTRRRPRATPACRINNGANYRNDLGTIASDGFNLVRLYNWDMARGTSADRPSNTGLDHINFLNYASTLGLKIVVPVSDFFLSNDQYAWNRQDARQQLLLRLGARTPSSTTSSSSSPASPIPRRARSTPPSIRSASATRATSARASPAAAPLPPTSSPARTGGSTTCTSRSTARGHGARRRSRRQRPERHDRADQRHLRQCRPGTARPGAGSRHCSFGVSAGDAHAQRLVRRHQHLHRGRDGPRQPSIRASRATTTTASTSARARRRRLSPTGSPHVGPVRQPAPRRGRAPSQRAAAVDGGVHAQPRRIPRSGPTRPRPPSTRPRRSRAYLADNKAGTADSTTNLMGYNYFEFNDEPAIGPS